MSNHQKTNKEYLIEHGMDFNTNTYLLIDEICPEELSRIKTFFQVIKGNKKKNKKLKCNLYIHTPGGDIYSAMALIDLIRDSEVHVTGLAGGALFSAGTYIFSVCDKRIIRPNTFFFFHDIQAFFTGTGRGLQTEASHIKAVRQIFKNIILKNTNISEKLFIKWCKEDKYVSAKDALKYGLADKIEGEAE